MTDISHTPETEIADSFGQNKNVEYTPTTKGYTAVTTDTRRTVDQNKELEEIILRRLDALAETNADKRWLAVGRTHIEQAFMAINRAVFKPQRIKLDGDNEGD